MPWYAIYTKSRFENKVLFELQQKTMVSLLPKILVWSKRRDRRKQISVPLFPGYVFVEMDIPDNRMILSVLKTTGVVRILGNRDNGIPTAVPDKEMETIMRLVSVPAEIHQVQYPRLGDLALIVDGPFKGIEGHVVKTDYKKELFVISFEFLNRHVAMPIDGYQIRKV